MIRFRFYSPQFAPVYMTAHSAGADLKSRIDTSIQPGERAMVPTGVWIESVDWNLVPNGLLPEIQIRARSGWAHKFGIMLSNGVGTVDADYRDEIQVLLFNAGAESFSIQSGDRVAQMALNLVYRFDHESMVKSYEAVRDGGFGSTEERAIKLPSEPTRQEI